MKAFLRRSSLQLLTAFSQIAILALFLVAFPKLADDAAGWAADYFVSLAIVTPIFMLFGFELRKRSAAEAFEDLDGFNGKRVRGTGYATLVCVGLAIPAVLLGFVDALGIYAAILVFRIGTAINDQITANYEAQDRFGRSLSSNLSKTILFMIVSLAVGFAIGPTLGVVAGTMAFCIVWLVADRAYMSGFADRSGDPVARITLDDVTTGIGSFMVALTVSLPRLVAAAAFGEHILNMIGIGQSLNRIGQVLSGSFTQTMIALRKKAVSAKGAETRLTYLAQIATFVVMLCLIPVWKKLFPYADGAEFLWVVGAVLFFGLLSQINFVLQSIRLLRGGGRDFSRSPMTFLILFCSLTAVIWAMGLLDVAALIGVMLVSRIAQLLLNLRALRGLDPA